MTGLARKLSLWNYFALGFGTMIGTGWVILMDDWLGRGGPLGAMIGFLMGAAAARCGGRSGIYRAGVSTVCELPDGLDDAAGVFHRVPVGSSGAGEAGVVHFSAARYGGALSRGWAARFLATVACRDGLDAVSFLS